MRSTSTDRPVNFHWSFDLYNQCSVQFRRQAGVDVTFTKLEDFGIMGNGHFSILEKNSDQIISYIEKWLKKNQITIAEGALQILHSLVCRSPHIHVSHLVE